VTGVVTAVLPGGQEAGRIWPATRRSRGGLRNRLGFPAGTSAALGAAAAV